MKKALIFDLDGTLALCIARREEALKSGVMDWDVFFDEDLIINDEPNTPIVELFHMYQNIGYTMIIFTGRTGYDGVEEVTKEWLNKNNIKPDIFDMRKAGDRRDDTVVKKEMYDKIKSEYEVIACYDDRDRVVKLWRDLGLTCLQVAEGDF